jgi:hypothetical protein
MILDSNEQKDIILQAINSMPIQGDFMGIREQMPKFEAVYDAVLTAKISKAVAFDQQGIKIGGKE